MPGRRARPRPRPGPRPPSRPFRLKVNGGECGEVASKTLETKPNIEVEGSTQSKCWVWIWGWYIKFGMLNHFFKSKIKSPLMYLDVRTWTTSQVEGGKAKSWNFGTWHIEKWSMYRCGISEQAIHCWSKQMNIQTLQVVSPYVCKYV